MDDYACMWTGIEDLYIQATGETLPPKFFFVLASFGSFCYMKTPKAELKRMVALGDGRTRSMYEFLTEPDTMEFCGGFDKATVVLQSIGSEYHDDGMLRAAELFGCAAPVVAQIKEVIVTYLTGKCDETDNLPALFTQVAEAMKRGFEIIVP